MDATESIEHVQLIAGGWTRTMMDSIAKLDTVASQDGEDFVGDRLDQLGKEMDGNLGVGDR